MRKKIKAAIGAAVIASALMGLLSYFVNLNFLTLFQKILIVAGLSILSFAVDNPQNSSGSSDSSDPDKLNKVSGISLFGFFFIVIVFIMSLNSELSFRNLFGETGAIETMPTPVAVEESLVIATVPPVIDSGNDYSTETIAAFTTGYSYYENEQFDLAFPLIMQAAQDGYPEGELYVGCCYRDGKGVQQDSGAAFDWFSIAASHGNAQAQYNLGYCYYRGEGVRTNNALAFEWFQKSAEQNNKYGLLWTGFCYHKGVGVEQDYDSAQLYYEAAKLAGNQDAVDRLAELIQDRGY